MCSAGSGEDGDCEGCEEMHCVVGACFLFSNSKDFGWEELRELKQYGNW